MNRSLKSQPPFVQLVILGCITLVFFFVGGVIVRPLIMNTFHITLEDLTQFNYSKPGFVKALRALLAVLSIFIFLAPALVFAYICDPRPLRFVGFQRPAPILFLGVALFAVVCSIPVVSWLAEMNQHMHFPQALKGLEAQIRQAETDTNAMEKQLLLMHSKVELLLMIGIMAVMPAFVEEIFFRGVLQRIFIQVTGRPWAGIIITAIIFSAIHGQFLGFFPRALLGVILGALFWFSGSIWPGILAHFFFNAMQIVLVYYNPKFADGGDPSFSSAILGMSAIALTAVFWWMIKSSQTLYEEIYHTDDDFTIGRKDQYTS